MKDKFLRKDGETIEEYQLRLSIMKLVDGEDIDWEDIKELLNSNEHRDTLRRKGKGLVMAHEIYEKRIAELQDEYYKKLKDIQGKTKQEIEDKRLKELNNKILQLKSEKAKLKDERTYINSQIRTLARMEDLVEKTKENIFELNKCKPLIREDIDIINTEKDGIILLSDMHLGAYCDNILDQYNPDICQEKLNYFIDKCIQKIKEQQIQNVYFLVAGDIVSGIIHNTTRYTNRLKATEQVVIASEMLSEAINKVSSVAKVMVGILSGNHDRIVAKKEEHMEDENFVEFIREMVRLRLKDNKRIVVVEPQDSTLLSLDIRGYKIAVVHGNLDKKRNINRLVEMNGEIYDYILEGHYHKFQVESYNHTTIITNGAFAGEEYAKNNRLYNKPEQLFMTITDNGIEDISPINLSFYKK